MTDLLATHIQLWVLTYITCTPMYIFIIDLSFKFSNDITSNEIFKLTKKKIFNPSEVLKKISRPINIYQRIFRSIKKPAAPPAMQLMRAPNWAFFDFIFLEKNLRTFLVLHNKEMKKKFFTSFNFFINIINWFLLKFIKIKKTKCEYF